MARKVSVSKYVVAFLITALIFSLGLALGSVIDQKRISYLAEMEQQHKLDYDSLQIQYLYLTMLSPDNQSCLAITKTFEYALNNLEKSRMRLEAYTEKTAVNQKEYALIEREYLIAEIQYWLLAKKMKATCNSDIVTVLNFFQKMENCPRCDEQGFVLSYLKNVFKERILIFSFNADKQSEPMVEVLKSNFAINEYPTLIINDEKYSGFSSKDDLIQKICSQLKNSTFCTSEKILV